MSVKLTWMPGTSSRRKVGARDGAVPTVSIGFPLTKALLHPRKLTWIPKMMVLKWYLLSNMANLGIHVSFRECEALFLRGGALRGSG